jgi:DNA-binding transcriptional LysR family regulator
MNPTLRQMRAFTLAARHLHVTQSALSGLIKELEQTLGTRLFDRSTRRIALTDMGRELHPLFSQMIDDLDGALANIADHAQLRKGIVRIAAPQLMACTLLPEAIAAWRRRHPEVKVSLIDSPVEDVTTHVLSGQVDIGVGPERDLPSQLEARALMELPFEAVVPPAHPLAGRTRIGWDELAAEPFIALRGQFTELLLADMGKRAGAALRDPVLKPAHEVTFMTTALAMVAAGLGLTVCMPYAAPLVRQHGLRMVPLGAPAITRRFLLYVREQRALSPAAEAFTGFLADFVVARGLRAAPSATSSSPSSSPSPAPSPASSSTLAPAPA